MDPEDELKNPDEESSSEERSGVEAGAGEAPSDLAPEGASEDDSPPDAGPVTGETPAEEPVGTETDRESEPSVSAEAEAPEADPGKEEQVPDAGAPSRAETREPGGEGLDLGPGNVETIMDIEIPITVTFGSTSRPLREILHLAPGSRLELNHRADQPVVIKVNNKPFARGHVVVVDGCYAVKIEEIETTAKRIASLGE